MAYAKIHITNSTNYTIEGTIEYQKCKSDQFEVPPNSSWPGPRRDLCVLKKISATVHTPDRELTASPYVSSGIYYSQFNVVELTPDNYVISRIET